MFPDKKKGIFNEWMISRLWRPLNNVYTSLTLELYLLSTSAKSQYTHNFFLLLWLFQAICFKCRVEKLRMFSLLVSILKGHSQWEVSTGAALNRLKRMWYCKLFSIVFVGPTNTRNKTDQRMRDAVLLLIHLTLMLDTHPPFYSPMEVAFKINIIPLLDQWC